MQVITYRYAYLPDVHATLCHLHAASFEIPLGAVVRGVHHGECDACLRVAARPAQQHPPLVTSDANPAARAEHEEAIRDTLRWIVACVLDEAGIAHGLNENQQIDWVLARSSNGDRWVKALFDAFEKREAKP